MAVLIPFALIVLVVAPLAHLAPTGTMLGIPNRKNVHPSKSNVPAGVRTKLHPTVSPQKTKSSYVPKKLAPQEAGQPSVSKWKVKLDKDTVVTDKGIVPLFEGDIAGVAQLGDTRETLRIRLKSGVYSWSDQRWPHGIVYYDYDSAFTSNEVDIIFDAMTALYDSVYALEFQNRNDMGSYIFIQRGPVGSGCWSYVGRIGGAQILNLEPDCVHYNTIIHELNHALGFWHEQSRSDRDDYVAINWDNIPENQQHNFELQLDTEHFNHPYDFGSVMHYDWNAFAADPDQWTVLPNDDLNQAGHSISQWYGLSPTDVEDLNQLYRGCATVWDDSPDTGYYLRFLDGEMVDFGSSWRMYDAVSYIRVEQGCTLDLYRFNNFETRLGLFPALAATSVDSVGETVVQGEYNLAGTQYDNDARSVVCTCVTM